MACFHPLLAWRLEGGEVVFKERGKVLAELKLPCGQCIGCRLERSRQWAIRCVHESQMWPHSVFVTLTYDDEHVPHDYNLDYVDFQKFMRRLRKRKDISSRVRFYMCGEYGEAYGRPHFHAALFNCFFADRVVHTKLASGEILYRSETLSELWPYGFASIGDVTFESAAYIARYVTKKVTGRDAEKHYECVDGYTGEVFQRRPEFNRMSLKPGIGAEWYKKFRKDVYPRDEVIIRGQRMRPPRYYDKLLEAENNFDSDVIFNDRVLEFGRMAEDFTAERLAVKEKVTEARLAFKRRSLK